MKKIIYSLFAALAITLASCEKEEVGGTATQDVAGEWYVTIDMIDSEGDTNSAADLLGAGWFDVEKGIIRTFNTAANVPDQMYISDMATFGNGAKGSSTISSYLCFNVPVTVDQATGSFYTANNDFVQNLEENYQYDPEDGWEESERYAKVKIINGKITKDGGKQNNGSPDDTIEFDLYFDNNYDMLAGEFEYYFGVKIDHYHVKGIRYSGLAEND
ncbi:MAG: hypothetical protein II075_01270 [Bacteroidales bacterium]|nr:hypothetical protein [Bacteroidales bacterium]